MRINKLFRNLTLVGLIGASFLFNRNANADGNLLIYNKIDTKLTNNSLRAVHYNDSRVTDEYGYKDTTIPSFNSDRSTIYTYVDSNYLSVDSRFPTSNFPYLIKLGFEGNIDSPLSNHLEFSFTNPDFESKPIYLMQNDTSGNKTGQLFNVRRIISGEMGGTLNPSAGILNISYVSTGSYSSTNPYANYELQIGALTVDKGTLNITDVNDIVPGASLTIGTSANVNLSYGLSVSSGSTSFARNVPEPGTLELIVGAGLSGIILGYGIRKKI